MYLEAGQFNNILKIFYEMLAAWDNDLDNYQDFINKTANDGKPTGGMEINLMKGNQRYNKSHETVIAACHYIQEMQAEINNLRKYKAEANELKKVIEKIERSNRCRIADMY